ncbi:hypothetical protein OH76DRAFT_1196824 [Lentinus brumalis]|uniref:Uncharacterized protein n=1 Tax=Lentinus brumalis TaxID=2498619 RepID=A0A371CTA0_9APHY|nr:hypothetical protein OH76DRAFT_1196824 [Polyporus brumalis]
MLQRRVSPRSYGVSRAIPAVGLLHNGGYDPHGRRPETCRALHRHTPESAPHTDNVGQLLSAVRVGRRWRRDQPRRRTRGVQYSRRRSPGRLGRNLVNPLVRCGLGKTLAVHGLVSARRGTVPAAYARSRLRNTIFSRIPAGCPQPQSWPSTDPSESPYALQASPSPFLNESSTRSVYNLITIVPIPDTYVRPHTITQHLPIPPSPHQHLLSLRPCSRCPSIFHLPPIPFRAAYLSHRHTSKPASQRVLYQWAHTFILVTRARPNEHTVFLSRISDPYRPADGRRCHCHRQHEIRLNIS